MSDLERLAIFVAILLLLGELLLRHWPRNVRIRRALRRQARQDAASKRRSPWE